MNSTAKNTQIWWGYKHENGSYQAKRYFDQRDIEDAKDSSFCHIVVLPFQAVNREEALKIVEEKSTYKKPAVNVDFEGSYF